MLFNSYEFIFIFLPLTFFIYFYLNYKRLTLASKGFLVLSSLFFYSWWNIVYLPIILASILFNYSIGNTLSKYNITMKCKFHKKSILIFGIVANTLLLGYFKYMDFFLENINLLTGSGFELFHLTLPLAISFFTFQQIAYLVDSYKSKTKEYNLLNYIVFVTFFPQLIAGPIVHHKEMMPQFVKLKNRVINYKNISMGIFIFSIGFFKKVALADSCAGLATIGFDRDITLNFLEAWATSLSYTFQLYFDFSGYTDMAIGLALLFNIKLPINFNSPYKATNIQEFWRRWHITLSRFLKDYIYIPLGGNRKGNFRTYNNLMVTFLIAGIWHGAGWTFIFWGFLHGVALVIHKLWSRLGIKLWGWISWLITFNFINITWVFFRANDFDDIRRVLGGMIGLGGVYIPYIYENQFVLSKPYCLVFGGFVGNAQSEHFYPVWTFLIFLIIIVLVFKNSNQMLREFKTSYITLFYSLILFLITFLSFNKTTEFLYFNF